MNIKIKDLIKDSTVSFLEYRKGYLYYALITQIKNPKAIMTPTRQIYENQIPRLSYKFSVPISDIGDATFKANDKAIYFMRYISAALKDETLIDRSLM